MEVWLSRSPSVFHFDLHPSLRKGISPSSDVFRPTTFPVFSSGSPLESSPLSFTEIKQTFTSFISLPFGKDKNLKLRDSLDLFWVSPLVLFWIWTFSLLIALVRLSVPSLVSEDSLRQIGCQKFSGSKWTSRGVVAPFKFSLFSTLFMISRHLVTRFVVRSGGLPSKGEVSCVQTYLR